MNVGVFRIRFKLGDLFREIFRQEHLSGVGNVAIQMNFEMNMDRAALVPAWVKGAEFDQPLRIAHLDAAEKTRRIGLAISASGRRTAGSTRSAAGPTAPATLGSESGAHAYGIAMPDVDRGILQRRAAVRIHQRDPKLQWNARLALADILPHRLVVDVVGAFFLLGGQSTGGCSGHRL